MPKRSVSAMRGLTHQPAESARLIIRHFGFARAAS